MLLKDITDLITEDVEKLIPHLKEKIKQYIEQRKAAKLPLPAEYTEYQTDKWYNKAVDWVLRADPRFLKDLRKKKPLAHSKSPFAKDIIRWWLQPGDHNIELPEDIGTTAEALQTYNQAKQQGLKADTSQFATFDELITAIEPFVKGDKQQDSYEEMGLELAWRHDPWRLYKVDKFIPGEASSLYPGEVCHKAFEGTNWCVKYKGTFERSYSGTYYLVLYGRKRFALINFPSMQFKDPRDRPIGSSSPKEAAEFLQLLFTERPDFIAELALAKISRTYGEWHDFTPFSNLFKDQASQILNTPLAKETALRSLTSVQGLASIIGEWPNFQGWPEGQAAIQQGKFGTSDIRVIQQYVEAHGRDTVIEQQLPGDAVNKYLRWVAANHKEQAAELIPAARIIVQQEVKENPMALRSALALLAVEATIHKPQRWPEIEKFIKQADDARTAVAYVKYLNLPRFTEFEPLIASDDRAAKLYERITGIDVLRGVNVLSNQPMTPERIVRIAISRGEEVPDKEQTILQDLDAAIRYAQHVIGPWPELEAKLRQHGTPEQKNIYAKNVLMNEF